MLAATCFIQQVADNMLVATGYIMLQTTCCYQHVGCNVFYPTGYSQHVGSNMLYYVVSNMLLPTCWLQRVLSNRLLPTCWLQPVDNNMLNYVVSNMLVAIRCFIQQVAADMLVVTCFVFCCYRHFATTARISFVGARNVFCIGHRVVNKKLNINFGNHKMPSKSHCEVRVCFNLCNVSMSAISLYY